MESAVENAEPSVRRPTIESVESFEINLKRVLLPTHIAGWISGLEIIEYPLGHPRSIISILYASMIYGSFLLLSICIAYPILRRTVADHRILSSEFPNIGLCIFMLIILNIAILHWANQKKIKSCLRRLAEIKMEMKQLGYNENHARAVKIQRHEIVTVVILMTFFISQMIRDLLKIRHLFWLSMLQLTTARIVMIFLSLMSDIIFINYVTFIKWEFAELREKMNELFSGLEEKLSIENSNVSLEENAQDYCDSIKTTRRLHLNLVKLSRRVNNAYGVQILLSLITSTIFLIISLHNFLHILKRFTNGDEFTVELIYTFLSCAFLACKILLINLTCGRTMDEAAEIGYVIMKLNIAAINKRMELETRLFTMQLLQNPVKFTAQGFFNLGYSCILLVISIITVYLSVLMEVHKPIANIGISLTGINNSVTE